MSKKYTSFLPIVKKYFESDPVAAAQSLETMPEEDAILILKELPPTLTSKAFRYLQVGYAANLLKDVSPELFNSILSYLEPQQGAAIFMHLPKDSNEQFLNQLSDKTKKKIQEYLSYPEDSIGRIMTTDFVALHKNQKVKDAIQKIRQIAQKQNIASYIYVIDDLNHLVGVINMRDLIIASPDSLVDEITRKEAFSIHCFTDCETAANELSKRNFFAAPVVDSENKLIGIIKAEQLIKEVQEEVTEDIQRMFGAGGDEKVFSPVGFSLKKRLPWLYVNLFTAFLAAFVVGLFEEVIAKITILAVFLPVVAGQGGNAGAQSLAIVIRGLVMREISKQNAIKLILKEGWIGMINGIVIGVVTGLAAWAWHGNCFLGLVIGLAMIVNLFVAGLSGAAIPITMKAIGLDPAQCSNIILTTITDVMGFLSFLGFAALFYNFLI